MPKLGSIGLALPPDCRELEGETMAGSTTSGARTGEASGDDAWFADGAPAHVEHTASALTERERETGVDGEQMVLPLRQVAHLLLDALVLRLQLVQQREERGDCRGYGGGLRWRVTVEGYGRGLR